MESSIKERLKIVRKMTGLTQEKFGQAIGSKQNTIAGYEMGIREPSNSVITLICKEFGINDIWLKTGEGEIKRKLGDEERFAFNIGKLQNADNETVIRWVNAIAESSPELLQDIEKFFMNLLDIKKEPD